MTWQTEPDGPGFYWLRKKISKLSLTTVAEVYLFQNKLFVQVLGYEAAYCPLVNVVSSDTFWQKLEPPP